MQLLWLQPHTFNWVYGQALNQGAWSTGELLSLTELRHIHRLVLTPAWDVEPHPSAAPSERPGSFREHDIRPFPGGMRPPPWPEFVVPAAAGPSHLVPLPALASEQVSANALRVAATRGRLNASKAPDGTWRSTRAWVDEYLAGRYARET